MRKSIPIPCKAKVVDKIHWEGKRHCLKRGHDTRENLCEQHWLILRKWRQEGIAWEMCNKLWGWHGER